MAAAGIEGEYQLYHIPPKKLPSHLPFFLKELAGFNCTIPYKQAIIPYLSGLAPSGRLYGAVNTVSHGIGYNTDGQGFNTCKVRMTGKVVQIIGTGGVAGVLAIEAARAGAAKIIIHGRNREKAQALVARVRATGFPNISCENPGEVLGGVLLNATPVGMWPQVRGLAAGISAIDRATEVFDTVYNPSATRMVLRAKSRNIPARGGLDMLVAQAVEAQRIWHPHYDFSDNKHVLKKLSTDLARLVLRQNPFKLLLTGFMGSGKSTVGLQLSQAMVDNLPFIDLDALIAEEEGEDISTIFASSGEKQFRTLEKQALIKLLKTNGPAVIATGGGALVEPDTASVIQEKGALVVYLNVTLETALQRLAGMTNRPLLTDDTIKTKALYDKRRARYEEIGDLTVSAELPPADIVDKILAAFAWNQ